MIVFCEDCGSKNQLDPAQIRAGKAMFRCSACDYWNSYQFGPVAQTNRPAMDDFLQEIIGFSQIIGSFVFHVQTGVLNNCMPGTLQNTDLNRLGKILTENYLVCSSQYPDVTDINLVISGKNMITHQIKADTFVILVATSWPLPPAIMSRLKALLDRP